MISLWQNPSRDLKLLLPAFILGIAVFLDALPIPHAGPTAAAPLVSLIVIFFWLVYRPELMGPEAMFVACLFVDAFGDLPLGLTALAFLLTRAVLMPRDRSLSASPFLVIWLAFALAAATALGFRWLLASFWWSQLMPVGSAFFEWMLTVLFYPIVGFLLSGVLLQLPKVRHASGK